MKITCEKHGEVEVHPPDKDGKVFCPKCMCQAVEDFCKDGGSVWTDELGYPVLVRPYIPLQVTPVMVEGKHKGVSVGGSVNVAAERANFIAAMEGHGGKKEPQEES